MYIIKNAFKCISRSVGRNVLIGVIVLVIATSACLGLSIRQAAQSAKEDTLSGMSVTATISYDRSSVMNGMMGGGFDRDEFANIMNSASSLSLDGYLLYAQAESVKDFYYTLTSYVNGTESFLPVSTETSEDTETSGGTITEGNGNMGGFGDMFAGMGNMGGMNSDFTIVGYSGENAMEDFINSVSSVTSGTVFAEGEANYECIISEELAAFNSLSVGDTIVISNPANEEEVYTLTVVGFYTNTAANENSFSMLGSTATDPANQIYVSYATLAAITDASEEAATTQTDEETGIESSTALTGSLYGTYVFADAEDYYAFEEEVRELGLSESYTVSSADITSFENSLVPLETLSTMASTFLIVILLIGAVILVVLNIFNVRERKYEIGVLTAMGMKKGKVALQFLTEIFAVTLVAVFIGIGVGAVSSVPVTNALLENQITSQNTQSNQIEQNFGRPGNMGDMGDMMETPSLPSGGGFGDIFGGIFGEDSTAAEYITEINSAMNFTVVLQMLGIAILLTLVSGMVGMLFVMRYEPLKILANRD